jgi:hypothetical protein
VSLPRRHLHRAFLPVLGHSDSHSTRINQPGSGQMRMSPVLATKPSKGAPPFRYSLIDFTPKRPTPFPPLSLISLNLACRSAGGFARTSAAYARPPPRRTHRIESASVSDLLSARALRSTKSASRRRCNRIFTFVRGLTNVGLTRQELRPSILQPTARTWIEARRVKWTNGSDWERATLIRCRTSPNDKRYAVNMKESERPELRL